MFLRKLSYSERMLDLMLGYKMLPYQICDCDEYREGRSAWAMFNRNNKEILFSDLEEVNAAISATTQNPYLKKILPPDLHVSPSDINFSYHEGAVRGQPPATFIEYWPLTSGGYPRDIPLIVHFQTVKSPGSSGDDSGGILEYAQDGSVARAHVTIWRDGKTFDMDFGLIGRSFVCRSVKILSPKGKLVQIYSSDYDFADLPVSK